MTSTSTAARWSAGPPPSGAGNAAALAQMLHPGDAIQAAREALLPFAAAAAMCLVAAWGRLRGAEQERLAQQFPNDAAAVTSGLDAWT